MGRIGKAGERVAAGAKRAKQSQLLRRGTKGKYFIGKEL